MRRHERRLRKMEELMAVDRWEEVEQYRIAPEEAEEYRRLSALEHECRERGCCVFGEEYPKERRRLLEIGGKALRFALSVCGREAPFNIFYRVLGIEREGTQ